MRKIALTAAFAGAAAPAFAASGPFFSLANTNFVVLIAFLVFIGVLVYFTNQLESGNAHWHDLATAEVVIGSICGLVLAIELTVIVLNVAIWVVVGILAVVALFVGLAILGAAASG